MDSSTIRNLMLMLSASALLAILLLRSFATYTPWEWLGGLVLAFFALNTPYAIWQLRTRHPGAGLLDTILEALSLIALGAAILALPEMRLSIGLLAVHHYLLATRIYRVVKENKGLRRTFPTLQFNINAALNAIFALISIGGFVWPGTFTQLVLSIALLCVGIAAGIAFFGSYRLPRHG